MHAFCLKQYFPLHWRSLSFVFSFWWYLTFLGGNGAVATRKLVSSSVHALHSPLFQTAWWAHVLAATDSLHSLFTSHLAFWCADKEQAHRMYKCLLAEPVSWRPLGNGWTMVECECPCFKTVLHTKIKVCFLFQCILPGDLSPAWTSGEAEQFPTMLVITLSNKFFS